MAAPLADPAPRVTAREGAFRSWVGPGRGGHAPRLYVRFTARARDQRLLVRSAFRATFFQHGRCYYSNTHHAYSLPTTELKNVEAFAHAYYTPDAIAHGAVHARLA